MHAPLPFEPITFLAFTCLPLPPGLSDFAARFGIHLTLVAWMIHGPLGFRCLHPIPSSDWALLGYGLSPLYLAHCFLPCVCELASAPAMPLHSSCYNITYPFALLLVLGLWAKAAAMSISYIIPSFGLTAQHSCWANPFRTLGFLGPFHSLGVLGPFHPALLLSLPWVFC